jgi:hypothetical protein
MSEMHDEAPRAPKVTIGRQTPSQQLIAEATREAVVKDKAGRSITLTRPGALAQFRIVKALGDLAANSTYMQMVFPLLFVTAIDGEATLFPRSDLEVEAIIQRLDEDGIAAVLSGVQAHFIPTDPAAAADELKKARPAR